MLWELRSSRMVPAIIIITTVFIDFGHQHKSSREFCHMLLMSVPKALLTRGRHTCTKYLLCQAASPPESAWVLGFRLLILYENMLPVKRHAFKNWSLVPLRTRVGEIGVGSAILELTLWWAFTNKTTTLKNILDVLFGETEDTALTTCSPELEFPVNGQRSTRWDAYTLGINGPGDHAGPGKTN